MLSCFIANLIGQEQYGVTSFYLIDSLEINKISAPEKKLLDSSLTEYHQAKNDTVKIHIIERLVENSYDENVWPKYNEWLYVYINHQLETFGKNASDPKVHHTLRQSLANVINNKGYYYYTKSNYSEALDYYNKSLEIERKLNNKKEIAISLNNIGGIYKIQGKVSLALKYYNESLKLKEQLGNKKGIALSYNNIGVIYGEQGNLELALTYYKRSLELEEELGNLRGIGLANNNIGNVYRMQNKISLARKFYEKSLEIEKTLGNRMGESISYSNLASTYHIQKDTPKAIAYMELSIAIVEELDNKRGIASSYTNIAELYIHLKEYKKAKEYLTKALQLAYNIGDPNVIALCARQLWSVAKKQGNYQEAFEMYELEVKMRDSILNKENYKALIEQQAKYEYEKKKATDSVKNAVADKIQASKLRAVQLENEKTLLEVASQKKQKWFLYFGLILAGVFAGVIYNRFKITKEQKGVIENQKEAVENQKQQIEQQHLELETTHKEISDSIKYSERLQQAIFPSEEALNKHLNQHFVLFKPKDVVSGDFYWLQKVGKFTYFAVGDCTGHGIPGALVSVVCSNALNRSIKEFSLTDPNAILNKTRELVIETFAQSGKEVKDGMDIALCSHCEGEKYINFSGANNPLWIIRKTKYLTDQQREERATLLGEEYSLIEYKANKQPVGLYENMKGFEQTKINLFKDDTLYLFTDGFPDQFGGIKGKKYKYKPFKKLLLTNHLLEMLAQKDKIEEAFVDWKGAIEQVDDVCVVGIEI